MEISGFGENKKERSCSDLVDLQVSRQFSFGFWREQSNDTRPELDLLSWIFNENYSCWHCWYEMLD